MGRKALLVAFFLLCVQGLLVFGLLYIQATERHDLQNRFAERPKVTGSLLNALLVNSLTQSEQKLSSTLSTKVTQANLARAERGNDNRYAEVVTSSGHRLLGHAPSDLKKLIPLALAHGFTVGSVENRILPVAVAFHTKHGVDVLIQGSKVGSLSKTLMSVLSSIPRTPSDRLIIYDKGWYVLAGENSTAKTGDRIPQKYRKQLAVSTSGSPIADRFFARAPILNGQWNLLISTTQASLYSPISGFAFWLPWGVLLIALLAKISTVALLERADRSREEAVTLNGEIESKNEEIIKTNADLASFASVAAHDIRGPLRKSSSFIGLVINDPDTQLSQQSKDYFERATRNLAQLDQLTLDLVQYARANETPAEAYTLMSGSRLIHEILDLLSEEIRSTNAEIRIGSLPVFYGNEGALKHLLQNLISNSIKFRRVDAAPIVDIYGNDDTEYTRIFVQDNGIGIPAQYRDRVFEPFQRLHPTSVYDGTGIGLALCRRIIEKHKGCIKILDSDGPGTLIEIMLPKAR